MQPNDATKKYTYCPIDVYYCVCLPTAAAAVPSAIAQEDVDENLASSIVSEVLKDGDADDDETDLDSTNNVTIILNKDQTVDHNVFINIVNDYANIDV